MNLQSTLSLKVTIQDGVERIFAMLKREACTREYIVVVVVVVVCVVFVVRVVLVVLVASFDLCDKHSSGPYPRFANLTNICHMFEPKV